MKPFAPGRAIVPKTIIKKVIANFGATLAKPPSSAILLVPKRDEMRSKMKNKPITLIP
ncbi:hypothetical protein D9M68_700790 [compost metagenome]